MIVPFESSSGRPSNIPGGPFAILPIAPRDKRPLTPHGVKDATRDAAQITAWWKRWPDANVAAAMGEASGLWCLDVDPRNGGGQSLELLQEQTGPWPVTWRSASGGGGQHFFFRKPPDVQISNHSPMPGIDVLSDGKYVILPPSVHPSGRMYQWFFDEGPNDVEVAFAPPALLERLQAVKAVIKLPVPVTAPAALLTAPRVQEIRSALAYVNADDRDTWLHTGMALHSEAPNDQGYGIWAEWSQKSPKFDPVDQARVWRSFHGSGHAITMASMFKLAYTNGWPGPPALEVEVGRVKNKPALARASTPPELMAVPGVLNDLVRFDLMTAPRPNPQLAVQGALAYGSVVLSRRYVTDARNHAGLYLLSVAQAGTGKEHAKKTLERALMYAELDHLLGGSGYSSATALFSRLQSCPAHLTIIDEYGRLLESSRRSMSEHKLTAITGLMEVYGRADGVLLPTSFSTRGLTPKERREAESARVHCPGLTLLAMSTPDAFYQTLSDRSIQDGFLPRFVVVESETGRQLTQDTISAEPPDTVWNWTRATIARAIPPGDIAAHVPVDAGVAPHLVTIPFSAGARTLLRQLEQRVLDRQAELEREGLSELFGRTRENAMRLALVVALSSNPEAAEIDVPSTQWAIHYAEHYAGQTLSNVRERIVGGEFGLWTAEARRLVSGAGERGMTARELSKCSRKLRDLTDRQFNEVMGAVVRCGHAQLVSMKGPSGRGKPRQAWVLADLLEDPDDLSDFEIADNADKSPTNLSAIKTH